MCEALLVGQTSWRKAGLKLVWCIAIIRPLLWLFCSLCTSGKAFTRFCSVTLGSCAHTAERAFLRSGSAVGKQIVSQTFLSCSSQMCVIGVEVRALCWPFKFLYTKLVEIWIYGTYTDQIYGSVNELLSCSSKAGSIIRGFCCRFTTGFIPIQWRGEILS